MANKRQPWLDNAPNIRWKLYWTGSKSLNNGLRVNPLTDDHLRPEKLTSWTEHGLFRIGEKVCVGTETECVYIATYTGACLSWSQDEICFPPGSFDAYRSAWAMWDEMTQRIVDSGDIPDFDDSEAERLWRHYFDVSLHQIDWKKKNPDSEVIFEAVDGMTPLLPFILELRELEEQQTALQEQQRQMVMAYQQDLLKTDLTEEIVWRRVVEFSRSLSEDPVAQGLVEKLVDLEVPPIEGIETEFDPTEAPDPSPVQRAPGEVELLPEEKIINRIDLPPSMENAKDYDAMLQRDVRIYRAIAEGETYANMSNDASRLRRQLSDKAFWKRVYPEVEILPGDNQHLPKELLDQAYEGPPGEVPMVNVRITPRKMEKPEVGWLADNINWLGPVLNAIPYAGPALAFGAKFTASKQVQSWASDWTTPVSIFAPQYEPRTFTVPLPIDRAQYAMENPELVPMMVDQFNKEVRDKQIRRSEDAFSMLTGAMQPAFGAGIPTSAKTGQTVLTQRRKTPAPGERTPGRQAEGETVEGLTWEKYFDEKNQVPDFLRDMLGLPENAYNEENLKNILGGDASPDVTTRDFQTGTVLAIGAALAVLFLMNR